MSTRVEITDGPGREALKRAHDLAFDGVADSRVRFELMFDGARLGTFKVSVHMLAYDDGSGKNFIMAGCTEGMNSPKYGQNPRYTGYYDAHNRRGYMTLDTVISFTPVPLHSEMYRRQSRL